MDSDAREREIGGHYRMLKETARRPELPADRLGEEPDAKGEAAARIVQQFNRTIHRLQELGAIQVGMFAELPDQSSWAAISIAHEQLAAFIQPGEPGVRPDEEEVEETTGANPFILNFSPNLAPDFDSADIGALARDVMPKEMSAVLKTVHRITDDDDESDDERGDGADRLTELAEQLAKEDVSPEDISKAVAELRELAGRGQKFTFHVEKHERHTED